MNKYKYSEEFEINAPPRVIYPYLQSPVSLAEWFADKVNVDNERVLNFIWDNTDHFAKIVTSRLNKQIKYEFLNDKKQVTPDPNYIEFKLQQSELTNSTFLKVTDYSEMTSMDDLTALWHGLIVQLKEVIGGG
jgi:uncharacterized protein YndB with AHSA1/START domain